MPETHTKARAEAKTPPTARPARHETRALLATILIVIAASCSSPRDQNTRGQNTRDPSTRAGSINNPRQIDGDQTSDSTDEITEETAVETSLKEDLEAEIMRKAVCDSIFTMSQATPGTEIEATDTTIAPTSQRRRDQWGSITQERLSPRKACSIRARNPTNKPNQNFWPTSTGELGAHGWLLTEATEVLPGAGAARTVKRERVRCRVQEVNPDEISVDDNGQEIPTVEEAKNMAFFQKTTCWVHDRPEQPTPGKN